MAIHDSATKYKNYRRNYLLRRRRLLAARVIATHTQEEWNAVLEEVDFMCVRCRFPDCRLVKDHIIPIYQGGSDGIDNLQPICPPCNSSKGAETTNWLKMWREQSAARNGAI